MWKDAANATTHHTLDNSSDNLRGCSLVDNTRRKMPMQSTCPTPTCVSKQGQKPKRECGNIHVKKYHKSLTCIIESNRVLFLTFIFDNRELILI
mmetsp:Transcript_14834/g.35702  ORF Transcript_14834/g.35702 Transcript_14834/m.35702 type:complete len:94 (+) Transcript_14834:1105-1386(+)